MTIIPEELNLTEEGDIEDFRKAVETLIGTTPTDFHGEFTDLTEQEQDKIINPAHYKLIPPGNYPNGLEYMDVMEYALAHHTGVDAHLIGQAFKYLFRAGKKDAYLQDIRKAEWYIGYLITKLENQET